MTVQVDVQNSTDDDTAPEVPEIESWIGRTLDAAGASAHSEVSVRITDVAEIHALNNEYRGMDEPTNVLSFPAAAVAGLPEDLPQLLGDIVVCTSVVRDEALQQGKSVADHWAHMLVHGTLHLLGFDHETDAEAVAMEALETRILCAHGLPDPYGAPGET